MPDDAGTDVLIVGGGMAGLACALAMHKEGLSVKLFERAPVRARDRIAASDPRFNP